VSQHGGPADLNVGMSGAGTGRIAAGTFSEWLRNMRAVLRGERDADVPCGDCVGCCVSSYPIPLRPTDRAALDLVPAEHLHFPAVAGGLARMGYRDDGTCPMLCAGKCSIYEGRPQTCRDYDCRIYAAAGLLPDGDRPIIRQRVHAWRFQIESAEDRDAAASVQRAAIFIQAHSLMFPDAMRAESPTAASVLAVKCHELFHESACAPESEDRELKLVQCVIEAVREFDAQGA
jgi:uncharacterized protein